MICIPHHILSSDQIEKNDEMGGACGMCRATKIGASVFSCIAKQHLIISR